MRNAVALEPLSLILNARLGVALWRAGRLSEAEEQLRHTLDLDSTFQDARGTYRSWSSTKAGSTQRWPRRSGSAGLLGLLTHTLEPVVETMH